MELVRKGLGSDWIIRQSLTQASKSQSSRPGCSKQVFLLGKGREQVGAVADVQSRTNGEKRQHASLAPFSRALVFCSPVPGLAQNFKEASESAGL